MTDPKKIAREKLDTIEGLLFMLDEEVIELLIQDIASSLQEYGDARVKQCEQLAIDKTYQSFKEAHSEYNKGYEDCASEIVDAIRQLKAKP